MSLDQVLVSGASRGLGRETALQIAASGYQAWAGVRNQEAAEEIQAEAARRGVSTLKAIILDISRQETIDAAVARIAEAGPIYGLINNAGITARAFFEEFPEPEIRRIFEVNVFGTMALTRKVLPYMRKARRGRVVTITSVAGRLGQISLSPYVATKFALEGFSESLWLEMKPFNVHVTIVEPGIVRTDIWHERRILPAAVNPESPYFDLFQGQERETQALLKAARLEAADVAKAVVKALRAERPKLRYAVGPIPRLLISLRRHLPGEMFENLVWGALLRRVTKGARIG